MSTHKDSLASKFDNQAPIYSSNAKASKAIDTLFRLGKGQKLSTTDQTKRNAICIELSTHLSHKIKEKLCNVEDLPFQAVENLFNDKRVGVRSKINLIFSSEIPDAIQMEIAKGEAIKTNRIGEDTEENNEMLKDALISANGLSEKTQNMLANDENDVTSYYKWELSERNQLFEETKLTLARLSHKADLEGETPCVMNTKRNLIFKHTLSEKVQITLAECGNIEVKEKMLHKGAPDLCESVQGTFAEDYDEGLGGFSIAQMLAGRPQIFESAQIKIAKGNNDSARWTLAKNPVISDSKEVQLMLANDDDDDVKYELACNEKIHDKTVETLLLKENTNEDIRNAISERMEGWKSTRPALFKKVENIFKNEEDSANQMTDDLETLTANMS